MRSPAQVRMAVAYRDAHPDEINEATTDNRLPVADIGVRFLFIAVAEA
jgi:hypothetical protein